MCVSQLRRCQLPESMSHRGATTGPCTAPPHPAMCCMYHPPTTNGVLPVVPQAVPDGLGLHQRHLPQRRAHRQPAILRAAGEGGAQGRGGLDSGGFGREGAAGHGGCPCRCTQHWLSSTAPPLLGVPPLMLAPCCCRTCCALATAPASMCCSRRSESSSVQCVARCLLL